MKVCYVVIIDICFYLKNKLDLHHNGSRVDYVPMKQPLEQRFHKALLKIGSKNKICFYAVFPIMIVGMFFFHAVAYLRGNGKRLAMMAMTFLLFAVYSSFSFPIFTVGNKEDNGLNPVSEAAQDIELAEEIEIDLDEMEFLDDDDVIVEGDEYLESHGDIGELYSASEILEAAKDRDTQGNDRSEIQDHAEFSKDDWRLVLINKQHSIPDDYQVVLGKINTLKGTMYCDERIIDDYLAMLEAAQEDNVELEITSPYRDTARQEYLFDRKIKAYMKKGLSYIEAYQRSSQAVTVPGASEHQIGLALDIVTPTCRNLVEGFADTDAGVWLAENSYKYGFILRYPKGKEYITGIKYEPWHFRYVGVEAATVIAERGITLEEFWEEL